jgi:RNA polymerase sigma factor (sigma-70 family)
VGSVVPRGRAIDNIYELIVKARNGCDASLNEVFNSQIAFTLSKVRQSHPNFSEDVIWDIASEALMNAIRAFRDTDGWINCITWNIRGVISNYARKQKRKKRQQVFDPNKKDYYSSPLEEMINLELDRDLLESFIDRKALLKCERQVLKYLLDGLTNRDISKKIKKREQYVGVIKFRLIRKLKEQ